MGGNDCANYCDEATPQRVLSLTSIICHTTATVIPKPKKFLDALKWWQPPPKEKHAILNTPLISGSCYMVRIFTSKEEKIELQTRYLGAGKGFNPQGHYVVQLAAIIASTTEQDALAPLKMPCLVISQRWPRPLILVEMWTVATAKAISKLSLLFTLEWAITLPKQWAAWGHN